MFNKFFDHIFLINLDRRQDRFLEFQALANDYKFSFERISAVDGKDIDFKNPLALPYFYPGDVGCTLSHLKVVTRAKELGLKNYLVFEDDVVFKTGFKYLFEDFLKQVPQDWDMIYFGANHNNSNPAHVADNVVKINTAYTTHAIAVKETVYDALIEVWSDPVKNVDVLLGPVQQKYNCYCFHPNLAGQRAGKSDILDRDVNYDFLLK